MRPEGLRLSPRHRALFYGSSALLFTTGLLWLLFHHFVQVEGSFGPEPHPLQAWWLQLHGAAAMLSLLIVGSLLRGHVRTGWTSGRNRISGAIVAGVVALLIATGWALYYISAESVREWTSALHWGLGLGSAGMIAIHVVVGRRSRRRHVGKPGHRNSRLHPRLRLPTHQEQEPDRPPVMH